MVLHWDALVAALTQRWQQSGMSECVQALQSLHGTLVAELQRCHQMELSLFDARTALAQAQAELAGTQAGERLARHLSQHDALTALPNRTHFCAQLEAALNVAREQGQSVVVLYLDLDGFKQINDQHGHAVGDEVLRIVAARLSRSLRSHDVVGRLGGDEFACLLTGMQAEQLPLLADKLMLAVTAPLALGPLTLHTAPSMGLARFPQDGEDVGSLLRHADAAMYRAKRLQLGHVMFDDACDAPLDPSGLSMDAAAPTGA